MFIVKFQGALGNQMFEYAFMKRMEKEYPGNKILGYVPTIHDFNGYELEKIFNVSIPKANIWSVAKLSNYYPNNAPLTHVFSLWRKYKWIFYGGKESHIMEDDNTFYYKEIFELNPLKSYFLDGVWANSQYSNGIEEELKKAFVFPDNRGNNNNEYLNMINYSESVCVHVRRNEYVKMGLSVVTDDYYKNAIKLIQEKVSNPRFFVFSDDHQYCQQLFDGMIDYTLVQGNKKENSFRDMELMSCCKHNIIANSTFSFWGAFLNSNPNKIVITPNISWGNLKCPYKCKDWIEIEI